MGRVGNPLGVLTTGTVALDVHLVEYEPQLGRLLGVCQRVVTGDESVAVELFEALVERLHPVEVSGLHLLDQLAEAVGIADALPHPSVDHEHLDRGDATLARRPRQQSLGDHAPERSGEHRARGSLTVRWKQLHESGHRVDCTHRRHAREHEVPGLGGLQRSPRGVVVGEATHHHDVGVLAQRLNETRVRARCVGTDLALVDDGALVGMEHLDGVLDRHDVALAAAVDMVHHRGERGRLPGRRQPRHEHETTLLTGESHDRVRQEQGVEARDAGEHPAQHQPDPAPLADALTRNRPRPAMPYMKSASFSSRNAS